MNEERQRLMRGHIGRGFLLSFFVHAGFLFPFIVLTVIFARREAENRDVDVKFEKVAAEELPDDLPPLDEALPTKPDRAVAAEEEQEPPPPTMELPPPEEKKDEPKPVPERRDRNAKMVDLDMGKEVEPPPDAKYLAQKNNRAEEETRARDTNLEREQKGQQPGSTPSDRKDDEVGDADRKIAELEDVESQRGREAPKVTPRLAPQPDPSPEPKKSPLAMREVPKRDHEITPETADPTLPRDPDGLRPMPPDFVPESVKDLAGGAPSSKGPRMFLSGEQYRYLFGDDAEAAQRLAQKERSRRPGRFADRMGKIQSALENFIPEVRPGNQTALNTRAAPFAAFIARMHRSIHKLWGFGFLEDLDRKPASNPFNDPNLITRLEIVLNGDGTVHKVTVVRSSGYLPFDVAAIDVVHSAAPYAEPPREIRSGNGKIYVHWTFHRDERQCATSGVDYYILDNAGADADKGETGLPAPAVPRIGGPKRLERFVADTPEKRRKMRELDEAAGDHEGHEGHTHEGEPDAARRAAQQVVRADDPAARATAEQWFQAYVAGDVGRMLRQASFPFKSTSGVAAKSADELGNLLRALIEETPRRAVRSLRLYSPAGARGALGNLPPGFEEGGAVLFAAAQIGDDALVLVLAQQKGGWRAVGMVRR